MIIGVAILLISNSFLPRVYNVMINTVNNTTVSMDVNSKYLMSIYIKSPAYIVVMLNDSYPLPIYVFDSFGHVLTPLNYKQEGGIYLVMFPLLEHGNYSLVLLNDNSTPLNVSLLVTSISQYMVSNAVILSTMMDLGVVLFIIGVLFVTINILYIVRSNPKNEIKT